VTIAFAPEGTKGKPAFAEFSTADNTFSVSQMVPGTYKVSVQITPYMGEKGVEKRVEALSDLNTQFGAEQSKLKAEITGDLRQTIKIDLQTLAVTKG
jgi:hypothetical protein